MSVACDGHCAEAETSLRHLVSVMPSYSEGWSLLGNVLLADTGNSLAARSAFEQRWLTMDDHPHAEAPSVAIARVMDEYRMAVFDGDLRSALRSTQQWAESVRGIPGRARGDALVAEIETLQELGNDKDAREVAASAVQEWRGWAQDEMLDFAIILPRLGYLTGAINAETFRALRQDWAQEQKPSQARLWLEGFAGLPDFEKEMPAPITTNQLIAHESWRPVEYYGRTSAALLRLGRKDEALAHAKGGAKMCVGVTPMPWLRAKVALADAYAATDHREEACGLYARLAASLRLAATSRTAEHARQQALALRCPPQANP
jgi:hypothetical protein